MEATDRRDEFSTEVELGVGGEPTADFFRNNVSPPHAPHVTATDDVVGKTRQEIRRMAWWMLQLNFLLIEIVLQKEER